VATSFPVLDVQLYINSGPNNNAYLIMFSNLTVLNAGGDNLMVCM